ncbi:CoxG family protein [Brevibacillus sp. H7]|uniref:CoxG family protein n=1 Tax=Brevibacillus sp. H7 TaxID=3349138 RepID=UPI003825580D
MQIEYSHKFHIPRETVWKLIQEEEVLKKSIPGCKSFIRGDDDIYHVEMGLSVGPVKGVFTGQVRMEHQMEPSYYRLLMKGKGMPGEIDATAHMNLEESNGGVIVNCRTEVMVTGVLASVGQRVMGGVAKLVLGQFFKSADTEMRQLASRL